jgi:hypothetical protein
MRKVTTFCFRNCRSRGERGIGRAKSSALAFGGPMKLFSAASNTAFRSVGAYAVGSRRTSEKAYSLGAQAKHEGYF